MVRSFRLGMQICIPSQIWLAHFFKYMYRTAYCIPVVHCAGRARAICEYRKYEYCIVQVDGALDAEVSRKFLSLCIFVHHLFPKVTRSFFQLGRFWKMAVYKNAKTKNLPGTLLALSSRVTIFSIFGAKVKKNSTLHVHINMYTYINNVILICTRVQLHLPLPRYTTIYNKITPAANRLHR